ncbi:hypothetical protein JTE90_018137 [Oedothorax gibbosus]|uniref:Uncharacterized protein n=1 Tax=Oedothorax gibbosus TaxID=931172 RepID=A0AAV6V118_9ARAC|nr:hypothetical protein JTE90_018137 [Oedothorax gibbosus]
MEGSLITRPGIREFFSAITPKRETSRDVTDDVENDIRVSKLDWTPQSQARRDSDERISWMKNASEDGCPNKKRVDVRSHGGG